MLLRFWHKLFAHRWDERVFRLNANPDQGRYADVHQYIRVCRCGATQMAQVMGTPVDPARLASGLDPEIEALRRIANLDSGK